MLGGGEEAGRESGTGAGVEAAGFLSAENPLATSAKKPFAFFVTVFSSVGWAGSGEGAGLLLFLVL